MADPIPPKKPEEEKDGGMPTAPPQPQPGAPAASPTLPQAKPPAEAAAKPAAPPRPAAPPPKKTETTEVKALTTKFPGTLTHLEDTEPSIPTVLAPREQLLDVLRFLQADQGFEHLALITGVDYKEHIEVIYNLWSYSKNLPFEVKVRVPRNDAKVPSVTGLWVGANWHEREEFDLMGIVFEGHPDLRRILLPPGWKGHPLRKDYEWKREQYVALDPETGEDIVYAEQTEGSW